MHQACNTDHHTVGGIYQLTRLTPAQKLYLSSVRAPGIRQGKGTRMEQEGKKISIAENKNVTFEFA